MMQYSSAGDDILEKLSVAHEGDTQQLRVITSEQTRIIVEAPAGYGKTTTMVSRIAYLLATGQIAQHKKILGLTFSVNAALKAKREIFTKLPDLLRKDIIPNSLNERLLITNYHGLCKRILKKYGYLLSPMLKQVDTLLALGDEKLENTLPTKGVLDADEKIIFSDIKQKIMEASGLGSEDVFRYNQIVTEKLLPRNAITHNAIILFTIELFLKFPEIRRFYNSYFQFLVIDEFQDTNIISWQLVQLIICESTKLLFMGDSLQRIYGFIGACPDIMARASRAYSMEVVTLDKNYRFRNNPDMLKLDNALRRNAECFNSPQVTEEGSLPCCWTLTQKEEATWISQKLIVLLQEDPTCKIAVLVRMRGQCTSIIEDELKQNALPYFHALFNDDDRVYIDFHEKCLMLFRAKHTGRFFSRKKLLDIAKKIEDENSDQSDPVIQSLVSLLYATIEKIATDYAELPAEDRKDMLLDILENHQLKQAMEYIDKPIVLSTLHGAKGLEWDHVILADTEQYVSTGFRSCSLCGQENSYIQQDGLASCKLKLPISQPLQTFLLEDLCLFYVGITRARKQAYISASAQRINSSGREFQNGKIPCFAFLKGVKPYWCNAPTK